MPRFPSRVTGPAETRTLRSIMPNSASSAFDHDQGPKAGHLLPYARPIRSVNDLSRILICFGHLLVYRGPVGGAYQDPLVLQLSPEVPSLRRLLRGPAPQLPSRPVGTGAEGLAHGPFGAGQHEGVAAHVPGHHDRLPYRAVAFGQFQRLPPGIHG